MIRIGIEMKKASNEVVKISFEHVFALIIIIAISICATMLFFESAESQMAAFSTGMIIMLLVLIHSIMRLCKLKIRVA